MTEAGQTSPPGTQSPPTTRSTTPTGPVGHAAPNRTEPSGWVGWVIFAGIMMILLGAFQIIEGLVALFARGYYVVGPNGLVLTVNYATWGWVHFGIGVVAVLAGLGVLAGQAAARVVGIIFAALSAIVNLGFIAAYPIWSIIVIILDVIVIYALAVHGREMRT